MAAIATLRRPSRFMLRPFAITLALHEAPFVVVASSLGVEGTWVRSGWVVSGFIWAKGDQSRETQSLETLPPMPTNMALQGQCFGHLAANVKSCRKNSKPWSSM